MERLNRMNIENDVVDIDESILLTGHNIKCLIQDSSDYPDSYFDAPLLDTIFVDDRQKKNKHIEKHNYLEQRGYKLITKRLVSADYAKNGCSNVIDTKHISELPTCLGKEYARFQRSIEKANNLGFSFYLLIETNSYEYPYRSLDDFRQHYVNPECYGDGNTRAECPWYQSKLCDPQTNCMCSKWSHKTGRHPINAEEISLRLQQLLDTNDFHIVWCDVDETGKAIEQILN